jgi:hypothetical protein
LGTGRIRPLAKSKQASEGQGEPDGTEHHDDDRETHPVLGDCGLQERGLPRGRSKEKPGQKGPG